MDAAIFSAINSAHSPAVDTVMLWVSWLGYFPGVWFLFGAAALWRPRARPAAFRMCLAVALAYTAASGVLKPVIGRMRPSHPSIMAGRTLETQPPSSFSFPSGHAATAVAGAMAAARVVPNASWVFWALATLMAYSRVYLGVHYPSDLLGGALVGAACAWLVLAGRHPATWLRPPAPAGEIHVP